MDEGTRGYLEQVLNTRLNEVERGIEPTLSTLHERGDSQDPMDEVDATTRRSAWETMVRMQHRNRVLALEISAALRRIRNGDFGICVECGESIGLERLRVHPSTTVCIQCKRRSETALRSKVA
jgi:DnaK suppressor protein